MRKGIVNCGTDTSRSFDDIANAIILVSGELLRQVPPPGLADARLGFLERSARRARYRQYFLSRLRYCTASAMWSMPMDSAPARSAIVRETLRIRS
jgi:hypothetical protein